MKPLFLIPALALTLSPLGASNIGWPDIFGGGSFFNTPPSGGVFGGAQPKDTPATPDPDPDSPPPTSAQMTALSITGSGLLEFVFQQAYTGVEGDEGERIRAVLAPQYALLAQYLQGAFSGATQVEVPPDVLGTPAPDPNSAGTTTTTNTPDPGVSVTQAMAVVAATTLLNDIPAIPVPSASAPPAGVPPAGGVDPVLTHVLATSSSLSLLVVDTQSLDVGASVPEPSSLLLLASAGLALAIGRKRW